MAQTWTQVRTLHNMTVPSCACIHCCLNMNAMIGARQMHEPLGAILSQDWYNAFVVQPPVTPTSQNVND